MTDVTAPARGDPRAAPAEGNTAGPNLSVIHASLWAALTPTRFEGKCPRCGGWKPARSQRAGRRINYFVRCESPTCNSIILTALVAPPDDPAVIADKARLTAQAQAAPARPQPTPPSNKPQAREVSMSNVPATVPPEDDAPAAGHAPDGYNAARDRNQVHRQALALVGRMGDLLRRPIPAGMDEDQFRGELQLISKALRLVAHFVAPESPNYRFPLAAIADFDWKRSIPGFRGDEDILEWADVEVLVNGETRKIRVAKSVRWNAYTWVLRTGADSAKKYGIAIWYSRSAGAGDDDSAKYVRLCTFKDWAESEGVSDKTASAIGKAIGARDAAKKGGQVVTGKAAGSKPGPASK